MEYSAERLRAEIETEEKSRLKRILDPDHTTEALGLMQRANVRVRIPSLTAAPRHKGRWSIRLAQKDARLLPKSRKSVKCRWCKQPTENSTSRICTTCIDNKVLDFTNQGYERWLVQQQGKQQQRALRELRPQWQAAIRKAAMARAERQKRRENPTRVPKFNVEMPQVNESPEIDSQERAAPITLQEAIEKPFIAEAWQALRKATLDRDGRRCVVCGSRSGLTAHHIKSRSEGGEDGLRNLVSLCRVCHDKAEDMDEFGWRWIQSERARNN